MQRMPKIQCSLAHSRVSGYATGIYGFVTPWPGQQWPKAVLRASKANYDKLYANEHIIGIYWYQVAKGNVRNV